MKGLFFLKGEGSKTSIIVYLGGYWGPPFMETDT